MSRTCRVGVHGRNDATFHDLDYQIIRDAKLEAIKMMSQSSPAVYERIKREAPNCEIITRLYDPRFGAKHHPSPKDYVQEMVPVMNQLRDFCQKFQITNEPNHVHEYEGWGATDEDARNFNSWYLEVLDRLRQAVPWAKLGFPGLAVPDFLHRDRHWLGICREAVERSDWLGCHCYWQSPPGRESVIFNDNFGLTFKYYHEQFPSKEINILECGNSNIQSNFPISEEDVAREYVEWLAEVFKYPYINSTAYFLLSSPDTRNWAFFAWREESGRIKPIAHRIGQMGRSPRVNPRLAAPQPTTPEPPAPVEPTTPPETGITPDVSASEYTNQHMIDAFFGAGKALGTQPAPWGLLTKAGLTLGDLIGNRDAPYTGPALPQMINLSAHERTILREKLEELAPHAETGDVSFTNQNVIDAFHQAGRKLGMAGPWDLLVKAGFSLGALAGDRTSFYSGPRISKNPQLTEAEKSMVKQELITILGITDSTDFAFGSPFGEEAEFLRSLPELSGIPAAMPSNEQILISSGENALERRVARVWNRYGWALLNIADLTGIAPDLAVAIVAAESNDRGLDQEGRMIIRFEVNSFQEFWGAENPEKFAQHFRCDETLPWQKHEWRIATSDASWHPVHKNQDSEWEAFVFAQTLDESAAKMSVAMGVPLIMGCNYRAAGYDTVGAMYDAFAATERAQVVGLFDLIAGPNADSRELHALLDEAVDTFAVLYKSSTESAKYATALKLARAAFNRMQPQPLG